MNDMLDLAPILERVGAFVKREAMRMCPVDMGALRMSIDFIVEGNTVTIFSPLDYAEDMEWGTPPEPLSATEKENLSKWAERHEATPGKIIKYIEKHGIKVGTEKQPLHITSYNRDSYRPFLRPAVYMNIPQIMEIIKEGLK